jgi:hypothetical protein
MSAGLQVLAGLLAVGVYLVGLAVLRPECANDAAVIGVTFAVGLGTIGVVDLLERHGSRR